MLKRKIVVPPWVEGRTMYEVNLRQYSAGGTFKEFEEHLQRLKELGVGILWFMPVYPVGQRNRKGSLGSYYSIKDYKAINPEFGSLDEFRGLVDKIHGLGMKVILDWVANHTAWDHHWTVDHPEFYKKDDVGNFKAPVPEWEDVIHLDYGNPDLWDEMIGDMKFWVSETGVDGFRCDMAHLVPTLFWNRARRELDQVKPIFMLAESENHDLLEYAFDALYNWKLLHAMNDLAAGRMNAAGLMKQVINEQEHLPRGAMALNFTSNHDENSWQGSAIERLHYYLEPLTILTFLVPGIPLIYSGQEAGNYRRLEFFDRDEISWKADKMSQLYSVLAALRSEWGECNSEEILFSQVINDAEEIIASFKFSSCRKTLFVLLNLSGQNKRFYIKCSETDGIWKDVFRNENTRIECKKPLHLDPYGYKVLLKVEQQH
jgi:glycosidase